MSKNNQHNTKVIAYYLPQFHEIEENNLWWGKGFTEWTNVRNARPLYEGHAQPVVPYQDNYYNLLDKETVVWQTELAKKYGIYGMAYYHYWFEGKLLLEKPAENLLKWKDIPQNFFFVWANHTWYQAENGHKKVLVEQKYGDEKDWKNHYEYMNQFFQDDRYIKVNQKPVVVIHLPEDIVQLDNMLELWNQLARENGFQGIYLIESKREAMQQLCSSCSAAQVIRQPDIAKYWNNVKKSGKLYNSKMLRGLYKKMKSVLRIVPQKPRILDYAELSRLEATQIPESKGNIFYSIATGWDNTPRHKNYGEVMEKRSPEVYYQTLKELYHKSIEAENEFLFINAWNEWAEGMYLEPDEEYQYAFLEATKKACTIID